MPWYSLYSNTCRGAIDGPMLYLQPLYVSDMGG